MNSPISSFAPPSFCRGAAAVAAGLMALASSWASADSITFTSVAYPDAVSTEPGGIDGARIVGTYSPPVGQRRGFYYDGSNFTSLYHPNATRETTAHGIDGDTIVGLYANASGAYGYKYSISAQTWETLDVPGATGTRASGVDGGRIVGSYSASGLFSGFLHQSGSFATLNAAALGASETFAFALHGDMIGGSYMTPTTGGRRFAYTYDIPTQTFEAFVLPFSGVTSTFLFGIGTDYMSGSYTDANGDYGFLMNRSTGEWISIDAPGGVNGTYVEGVSGNRAVGYAFDADWNTVGFQLTAVPEPSTYAMSLAGLACGGYSVFRRRQRA